MAGTEWLVDASGCRADALSDVELLREVFRRIVAELNLRTVGSGVWHKFPAPGGVTGLLLLSESHLACHTYPEFGVATFNLYCCRARPEWDWRAHLSEMLGATSVAIRSVARPLVETPEEARIEESPYEATPNEMTPNEMTPNEMTPNEVTSNDATPNDATPNDATAGQEAQLVGSLSSTVARRGDGR